MSLTTILVLTSTLLLSLLTSPTTTTAQIVSTPTPAPAPAPDFVNLTDLLSVAGPFHTFLNYLVQTKVIETFQNQANNTKQGITIFVPADSAFSSLKNPSLKNLTSDQLKSLLLFHSFPKFYTFSDFKNLSAANPIATFAGGQYTLNVTDASGIIRVGSGWSDPKITSSVISTNPVAVYEITHVLLPEAIFGTPPPPAPAPAPTPAPELAPSDLAPGTNGSSPKSSEPSTAGSNSLVVAVGLVNLLVLVASSGLMVLF